MGIWDKLSVFLLLKSSCYFKSKERAEKMDEQCELGGESGRSVSS